VLDASGSSAQVSKALRSDKPNARFAGWSGRELNGASRHFVSRLGLRVGPC
jgi:hypothetical protein